MSVITEPPFDDDFDLPPEGEPGVGLEPAEVVDAVDADEGPTGWDVLAEEYEHVGSKENANANARVVLDVVRTRRYAVCARYKWVSPTVTEGIGEQAARMTGLDQGLYVACHTLAVCCHEVGFRTAKTPEYPDGLVSHPEGPVRFDARLHKALKGPKLDRDGDRVMQVVLHAFQGNEWRILQQLRDLEAFLVEPTRQANETFLGG